MAFLADLRQRLAEGTLEPVDWHYLLDSVTDMETFTEAFNAYNHSSRVHVFLADEFPDFYLTYAEDHGLLDEDEESEKERKFMVVELK